MTYYIFTSALLFFFTSFAYVTDRQAQIKLSFITVTFFAFFCGLRWYAGKDYDAYIDMYMLMPTLPNFSLTDTAHIHAEIGYKLLNSILKTMALESYLALFFMALFSLYLKFFFYTKIASNIFFCVCFYLALHFYRAEFIQVRMAIGLSILCVALLYYLKNDNLKFALGVILATTMHSICAVFFILLIARNFRLSYLLLLAFIMPVIFSFISLLKPLLEIFIELFNNSLLTILYNYAFNGTHGDKVFIFDLTPLRHLIIVLLLIVFYSKVSLLSETNLKIIKVYLIGIILTSFFMDVELLYGRAIYLFDIVEPVVLCMLIYQVRGLYLRASLFFLASFFPLFLMGRTGLELLNLFEYSTWLNLVF